MIIVSDDSGDDHDDDDGPSKRPGETKPPITVGGWSFETMPRNQASFFGNNWLACW